MIAYTLVTVAGLALAVPELHVVALYEGYRGARAANATAAVTVDRPGRHVVLVVSGNDAIDWEVKATAKTNLTGVVAIGGRRPTVLVPNGVPVEEWTYDAKKEGVRPAYIYGTHDIDDPRFRALVQKLSALTGLEIVSFQGAYRFDPRRPFVVDAVQKDERLSSDFPQLSPRIPRIKFEATRLTFGERRSEVEAGFGVFTHAGPIAGTPALPGGVRQVAYDPKAKRHYGIDHHELYAIDLKTRRATKIERPQGFSWSQALAHDAKRDRLVIATRGGLFEYDTKGGKWNLLAKERFLRYSAVAWQAKTDTLWAFAVERDPKNSKRFVPTLFELNANGAVANRTPLGSPLFRASWANAAATGTPS